MGIFNRSEGGQSLELIIKDTRGETSEAVSGVEELTQKEKVLAIIGPLASKPAMAAAIRAQELRVPIITLTQKAGITAEGDMVFRNFLTPAKEIHRLLDKAVNEMELRRFAILYPDNPYGRFFMNLFWDKVEEMGGVITAVESYKPDETDFAVEIKKMAGLYYPRPESVAEMLKEMEDMAYGNEMGDEPSSKEEPEPIVDFDAVFIPDNPEQVALIAPQFPFHNIFNVRLLGTSIWQSSELIDTARDYVQGAIFPSGFFAESESHVVREFVELYKESFESEPGILAANGYDTIMILKNLIDTGEIRTKRDFQEKLLQYDDFYGVTGRIAFDDQGEVEKEPVLLTISGKRIDTLP
jgi:ABC-type branched-subunit amino acid transport system substrate-binding protein